MKFKVGDIVRGTTSVERCTIFGGSFRYDMQQICRKGGKQ